MNSADTLPDVPEMVAAGLPLWAAFQIWSEMMASANRDPTYWRQRVNRWANSRPSSQVH